MTIIANLEQSVNAAGAVLGMPRICRDCAATFTAAALLAAYLDSEEGRNVAPLPCGVCGGWRVGPASNLAGRLADVAALISRLTNNRPTVWVPGQRAFQPQPGCRYAAIICADGVAVWRLSAEGWLDYYLGRITALTTVADVWRMRQQFGWVRAAELEVLR